MSQPQVIINAAVIIFIFKLASLLNLKDSLLNEKIPLSEHGSMNWNYFTQSTYKILIENADRREGNRGYPCRI